MRSMWVPGRAALLVGALCTLPVATWAAEGPSFLETPTYTLAGVLAFFLVLSTLFERSTHLLIWYLKRIQRHGLATAASNLVMELTLIGFISLILLVFQNKIHSICVNYSGGSYESWILLAHVGGCDCCLADTSDVGVCFMKARDCGKDFCNCDNKDQCEASEGLRRLLAGGGGGSYGDYYDKACDGKTALEVETQTCSGANSFPLVSLNALHQVHLFIFVVAVTHVVMGCIMILLADWRVSIWRHWAEDEDAHAQEVRRVLDGQAAELAPAPRTRFSRFRKFVGRQRGAAAGSSGRASPGTPSTPSAWFSGVWRRQSSDLPRAQAPAQGAQQGSPAAGGGGAAGPAGEAAGAAEMELAAKSLPVPQEPEGPRLPTIPSDTSLMDLGAGLPASRSTQALLALPNGHAAAGARAGAGSASRGAVTNGSVPAGPQGLSPTAGQASVQGAGAGNEQGAAAGGSGGTDKVDVEEGPAGADGDEDGSGSDTSYNHITIPCPSESPHLPAAPPTVPRPGPKTSRRLLGRTGTIRTRHGWVKEWAICSLIQLLPSVVTKEDFSIMRASFMLTHRVPRSFDFMRYICQSMEDDFAQIVGVSLEMWLTLVIFILVSGKLGWPVLLFLVLAFAIQMVVDTKLVQVMRHVCRGGRVNRLASNIFWFEKPNLLLAPIKFTLFLCSLVIGSTIFFAAVFGPHSCPLGNTGFWMWHTKAWWASLIIASYMFMHLSFKTLPLYSLCVQMGSDFKSHMLPKGVRDKLLRIAQHVKRKQQLREAQERAAAAGQGEAGGVMALEDLGRRASAVAGSLVHAGKLFVKPPKH